MKLLSAALTAALVWPSFAQAADLQLEVHEGHVTQLLAKLALHEPIADLTSLGNTPLQTISGIGRRL